MFKRVLSMLGMSSADIAQRFSQYGDPSDIQRAIDNGDSRSLGFIPKLAEQIKARNPDLFNQVQNMFQGRR